MIGEKGSFVVENARVVYSATLEKDFDWNLYILVLLTALTIGLLLYVIIKTTKMEKEISDLEAKNELLNRKLTRMALKKGD